jgi:hypothetical protein
MQPPGRHFRQPKSSGSGVLPSAEKLGAFEKVTLTGRTTVRRSGSAFFKRPMASSATGFAGPARGSAEPLRTRAVFRRHCPGAGSGGPNRQNWPRCCLARRRRGAEALALQPMWEQRVLSLGRRLAIPVLEGRSLQKSQLEDPYLTSSSSTSFDLTHCKRQEPVFPPVRLTRPSRLRLCSTAVGVLVDAFELIAKFVGAKPLSFSLPQLPTKLFDVK